MSKIVDTIFADVCLDERISDGIFRLEEEEHMNALRDYFVRRGLTKEEAVTVSNRMLEGRFPERQAYNKDGILVTFPTPQHKAKAIQRGTHFEKNPAPQNTTPPKEEPSRPDLAPTDKADNISPAATPAPEKPSTEPADSSPSSVVNKVKQGDVELAVEPITFGDKKPAEPVPQAPQPPQAPKTPERVAAEKEVIKQILATDDTALSPVDPPLNEELLRHQLDALYRKCDEWALREAGRFLKPYLDKLHKS